MPYINYDMPSVEDYIYAYESTCQEMELKFSEIAMEADSDTNIDDDANKMDRGKKIIETLKSIVEHIMAAIEKAMLTISNSLSKLYLTDKGYRKEMMDAMDDHKPRQAVRLIMYQYVDEALDQQYGKMKNTVFNLITKINVGDIESLSDEKDPLNMSKKDLETYILQQAGAPSNVKNMDSYFLYVKDLFRGGKKELVIQQTQIAYYKKLVDGYPFLKRELEHSKSDILNHATVMRDKLIHVIGSQTVPDNVKAKIITHVRNVATAYNIYSSFVGIMYQLKVEEMLSARIVLRKFYQF